MCFFTMLFERILINHLMIHHNTVLHTRMLYKITRSFIAFFDKTPIGSILNRFSNDLGSLDKQNWVTFHTVLWGIINILFLTGTVCIVNPLVFIPSVFVMLGLIQIRRIFTKPSVDTKRLDLVSRSPLYSEISATINGLLIIRVFRQGGRFIRTFLGTIYTNSKCYFFM
jgi:ABC-type multidrug transport system fused ATPase/permease subunit